MKRLFLIYSLCVIYAAFGFSQTRIYDVAPMDNSDTLFIKNDSIGYYTFQLITDENGKEQGAVCTYGRPFKNYYSDDYNIFEHYDLIIPDSIRYEGKVHPVVEIGGGTDIRDWFSFTYSKSVYIPASITKIHENSFLAQVYCQDYNINPRNKFYKRVDRAVYTTDMSTMVLFPKFPDTHYDFRIPDCVTSFYPNLFLLSKANIIWNNKNAKEIPASLFYRANWRYLPDSIEIINESGLENPFLYATLGFVPRNVNTIKEAGMEYSDRSGRAGDDVGDHNGVYYTIILPPTLKRLDKRALYGRTSVKECHFPDPAELIFLGEEPPVCEEEAIYDLGETPWLYLGEKEYSSIYVPKNSIEKYQALIDNGTWSSFNRIFPLPDKLILNRQLAWTEPKDGKFKMEYQVYELGDAKVEKVYWLCPDQAVYIDDEGNVTYDQNSTIETKIKLLLVDNYGTHYDAKASIRLMAEKDDDVSINTPGTENYSPTALPGVYNMQGIKIADSIDQIAGVKGIYIANGKKIVISK